MNAVRWRCEHCGRSSVSTNENDMPAQMQAFDDHEKLGCRNERLYLSTLDLDADDLPIVHTIEGKDGQSDLHICRFDGKCLAIWMDGKTRQVRAIHLSLRMFSSNKWSLTKESVPKYMVRMIKVAQKWYAEGIGLS